MSDFGTFFRQALGSNDNRPKGNGGSNVVCNGPVTINIIVNNLKKEM